MGAGARSRRCSRTARRTTTRRRRRRAAADMVELPGLELERGEPVVVVGERGVEVRIVTSCADAPPSTVTKSVKLRRPAQPGTQV